MYLLNMTNGSDNSMNFISFKRQFRKFEDSLWGGSWQQMQYISKIKPDRLNTHDYC